MRSTTPRHRRSSLPVYLQYSGGTGGDDVFAKVKGLLRLLRPMTIYPGNWRMRMSRADMEECLAKTQARIDKGDASVAKPSELVATLSEKVAGIDAAVADAAAMREKGECMTFCL